MAPKKDKADKKDDSPEDKLLGQIKGLELAKQDLEIGHAVLADNLRQTRAENERLLQEVERFRSRIINANKDYADILEHREEQVRVAEARMNGLQQETERLQATIAALNDELAQLKEVNTSQALRLEDAAAMLTDRDALEATVKKQHDLIERQAAELKLAKAQVESKETAVDKLRQQVDELTLKCAGSTTMRVMFSEPWLVQISHTRLRGEVPYDRECNTLSLAGSGKQLILLGGAPRGKDSGATELTVLSMEGMNWTRGNAAILNITNAATAAASTSGGPPQPTALHGHTATALGRNKLLVFGGRQGKAATSDTYLLALDTFKWTPVAPTGAQQPSPRLMHAAACIRDKVYIFGGMGTDGQLLNDMWMLDMDSGNWIQQPNYGYPPSPRRGCTMCATEDGRRLYVFGGYDGQQLLSDVYYCEAERGIWSPVTVGGTPPEPREGHTAAIIGKYLLVTGGCGNALMGGPTTVAAALAARAGGGGSDGEGSGGESLGSGARRLNDTYLMDLYTGPWWECLDDGAWGTSLVWMKQMSCYSVLSGNKLLMLKPNLHEQLEELQVLDLTLPEDIERMRVAKKRDTEQVDKLEILEEASVLSSNSIEVVWQAPSKNSERILGFKLMVASSTGVVKEAYQGKAVRHKVAGLKPNAEYVFCVKATYEDGSYLWSESKAIRTRMA